jgi:ATP-binding cassette subfamily B protein
MKLGNLLCMFWGANDMLTYCQMLALCVCAVYQSISGNLTVGDFIVFMSYNVMLIWPVRGLGRSLSEAGKARVSLGRLIEILEEPPEKDAEDSIEPDMNGDIVFENVSFSYPG